VFRDLLKSGYPCLSLHGGKDQLDREQTVADFKGNVCNLMIATSVAARGLDVKDLVLVVNYDVPNHYEVCARVMCVCVCVRVCVCVCPQPNEAQPRSHALTTSNSVDILTPRLTVWSAEGALNWRCPYPLVPHTQDYVHRVGRTGRAVVKGTGQG
jgi:hypothetical protein